MPSPPKPWEKGGAAVAADAAPAAAPAASAAPSVPQRPASGFGTSSATGFGATSTGTTGFGANRPGMYGSTYGSTGYGSTGYGTTGYGSTYGTGGYGSGYGSTYGSGYGGYGSSYGGYGSSYGGYGSSYSSPYNRFGGGYSSYSSPYSRFGSSYGGYGGGYGMGGMGGGYYSNGMNDPNSLSRNMEQSTAAAFGVLENIVFAFQGLSDMLGSTFHATHSSFMAMVAVVEQFGNLRQMLGGFLGLFGLLRFLRDGAYRLVGLDPPIRELSPEEFAEFQASETPLPDGTVAPGQKPNTRASRKPFLLFLMFAVGIPWIFTKLVRFLQEQQIKKERAALEAAAARGDPQAKAILEGKQIGPDGQPMGLPGQPGAPGKLIFARAKHPFEPQGPQELALERGDIVAVLSKAEPNGQPSEWWRGRTRDGRMGFFPGSYVEELPDPAQPPKTPAPAITDGKEERPASRPGSAQGMAGPGMPGMPGGMQGGMPGGMPGEPGKPF